MILWLSIFAAVSLSIALLGLAIRLFYQRHVERSRAGVHDAGGRPAPGDAVRTLTGNLLDVYRSRNRLSAYNGFHTRLGEIVQIFWMWRAQVSVASYSMAWRILASNQVNYLKRPPNAVLRRLFGLSVLSENGQAWKRYRRLMSDMFSVAHVLQFHDVFVSRVECLARKWGVACKPDGRLTFNILPDLTATFLDVIGDAALDHNFGALDGAADELLEALIYIVAQSTRPANAFIGWWKYMPTPANRRLERAFHTVDRVLYGMIRDRRSAVKPSRPRRHNLLDSLLEAADPEHAAVPLTDREVRDNLLAIVVNGHQTVTTCVALSLYLLARNSDALSRARAEIDQVLGSGKGRFDSAAVAQLNYLDCVISESLRLFPPMAGFSRVSVGADVLDGWSIPAGRVVGISLMPLHIDPAYFGEAPEHFRPERYLGPVSGTCPAEKAPRTAEVAGAKTRAGVCLPLTFGAGSRRCLGEHFAVHDIKVAMAILIHRFDFRVDESFQPNLELDKFGLFVSMLPTNGVHMTVTRR